MWGQSKHYCHTHINLKLHRILNHALDFVTTDLIRKYIRKVRGYEKTYKEVLEAGREVKNGVKNTNLIGEFAYSGGNIIYIYAKNTPRLTVLKSVHALVI